MNIATFFAQTDIVVVGQNSENADFDNPRGYEYGSAAFVVAEDEHGNRVRMHVKTERSDRDALAAADKVAQALLARLASGKLPVAFDRWQPWFPAYGSEAYSEADTIAWERSLEDQ